MNRKRAGALPQYVNFRGEPLGVRRDLAKAQQQHAERRTDEAAGRELTVDRERVIDALIVAGWQRGKTPP